MRILSIVSSVPDPTHDGDTEDVDDHDDMTMMSTIIMFMMTMMPMIIMFMRTMMSMIISMAAVN